MYRSQRLGLKYLTASTGMFGAMIAFGLLSSIYYIWPGFLLNVFNFSTAKIIHINGLVIWLLWGFLGAIYWFLPQELEREVEGIALAEILFWVFCAAVTVVVLVFLFVQYGAANEMSMWFINQGRKYVEAPRWAAIGITVVMGVFAYNVIGTTLKAREEHRHPDRAHRRSGAAGRPLCRCFPGDAQHVAGPLLVVVAGASMGGSDVGGSHRMNHGVDPDSSGGRVAPGGRELALR